MGKPPNFKKENHHFHVKKEGGAHKEREEGGILPSLPKKRAPL